ncbi:hypothetical protein ABT255_59940 [Streptomyces mirabilis]|uniref:hypothetical protein n=1 Tax=Streptomyces mirabilis TaxID=68239 RepID=UPI00332B2800
MAPDPGGDVALANLGEINLVLGEDVARIVHAAQDAPEAGADRAVSASGAVRGPGTVAAAAAARSRWEFMSSSNRP